MFTEWQVTKCRSFAHSILAESPWENVTITHQWCSIYRIDHCVTMTIATISYSVHIHPQISIHQTSEHCQRANDDMCLFCLLFSHTILRFGNIYIQLVITKAYKYGDLAAVCCQWWKLYAVYFFKEIFFQIIQIIFKFGNIRYTVDIYCNWFFLKWTTEKLNIFFTNFILLAYLPFTMQ